MARHRVSSEVPADREVERPPFFVPAFPSVSLSLLILANAPEEDYVVLRPPDASSKFPWGAKLAKSIRRRKDRSHVSHPRA